MTTGNSLVGGHNLPLLPNVSFMIAFLKNVGATFESLNFKMTTKM